MESSGKKSERMVQLELLLMSHPEGMRRAEIARRLGVHRATVGRYIDELSTRIPIWEKEYRVGLELDQMREFPRLGLLESVNLYLALDHYAQHVKVQNPPAAAVVRKIAAFLKGSAPFLSARLFEVAEKIDGDGKPASPAASGILEQLAEAWIAGRKVRILHGSAKHPGEVYTILRLDVSRDGNDTLPVSLMAHTAASAEACCLALEDITGVEILLDRADPLISH